MGSLRITLPKQMKAFADAEAARRGYASAEDYIGELIRQDWQRHGQAELEATLLEGINSGPATPMTREDWRKVRREVLRRYTRRQRQRRRP